MANDITKNITKFRILVTGGTGFIGGHLVERLVADGHDVRILTLPGTDEKFLDGKPVTIIRGDACDPATVADAMQGVEAVVHLASLITEGGVSEERYREVNVGGTRGILDAAERAGVKRVIFTSSINVFPPVAHDLLDESTPTNPDEILGQTKLEAELLIRNRCASSGMSFVILRPTRVYGPRDRSLLKLFRLIDRDRFIMIGSGEKMMHPIYVGDLVEALVMSLSTEAAGNEVFVVAGPEAVSKRQFCEAVAKALGKSLPRRRIPQSFATTAAWLSEKFFALIGKEPIISRRRIRFFLTSQVCRLDKARAVIGFEPAVGIQEGSERAAQWYRREGWL